MQNLPEIYRANESKDEIKVTYLYELISSDEEATLRFSCYDTLITAMGNTWTPAPISHSNPNSQEQGITLSASVRNQAFNKYFFGTPTKRLSLKLYRVNSSQLPTPALDEIYQEFYGHLTSIASKGIVAALTFTPNVLGDNIRVPRMFFSKVCNWCLFSKDMCKLNQADFTTPGTVKTFDINTRTITVSDINEPSENYYALGRIKVGPQILTVLSSSNSGDDLNVTVASWPIDTSVYTCELIPGCNKTVTTCENKFNNIANFGGHPFIPAVNPSIDGIDSSAGGNYGLDTTSYPYDGEELEDEE